MSATGAASSGEEVARPSWDLPVPARLEDYALIGDTHTAALVSRWGSMDWLCFPRFDSGACFAALVGRPEHGRWLITPEEEPRRIERRYREDSLVLETDFHTDSGAVRLIDFMPVRGEVPDVVRIVQGLEGRVRCMVDLTIRFDYGQIVPWIDQREGMLRAVAGPDSLIVRTPVDLHIDDHRAGCVVEVGADERVPFVATWHPSNREAPEPIDPFEAEDRTTKWGREWVGATSYDGQWSSAVRRSLLTLKALTFAPTGGIIAAPTTSLPEKLGGVRNWDYRYCWLRDATFTLNALLLAGFEDEAAAWRDWLLRAVAGKPEQMQIMYGASGERRLIEVEAAWLPGYEGSQPVRLGNDAYRQFQLDVAGEVMDVMHQARGAGVQPDPRAWEVQQELIDYLESRWRDPDYGIWEVRGEPRHFTHSKVMAWVAADRAVRAVEDHGLEGPADRWRDLRRRIHEEVCQQAWNEERGAFTQYYGADHLDASLLTMPQVGFLPLDDDRIRRTIDAIERELMVDGLVLRYRPEAAEEVDGLPPGEGAFVACSLWLADAYALQGRTDEATELFERVLSIANDVGLLAEEYDCARERMVGNFPQAYSHVAVIDTAYNLHRTERGPAERRAES